MKLIVLITADLENGLEAAQAWQDGGAPGVTLFRSHGMYRLRQEVERGEIELPRMVVSLAASMARVLENMEYDTATIVSIVPDDKVDALIEIANRVCGDLSKPDTGILFVLDVERAIGIRPTTSS